MSLRFGGPPNGLFLDASSPKLCTIHVLGALGFQSHRLEPSEEKFPRQAIKKYDKITAVNGKAGNANDLRRTGFET